MEAESAAKERTEPSGKLAFSDCGFFVARRAAALPRGRKNRERGAERTAPLFPETEKPRARSRTDRSAFFP